MKSLVQFVQESKIEDYKKICNTALKAVEILKKENKDWLKYAKDETTEANDDYMKFEDTVLNDHTAAPATWKLVEKTAELLNVDPDDLFEEVGLDPFIDVY